MLDIKLLSDVHYVVDSQGKKAAVQLDLNAWNALLDYLEDLENRAIVKEKLARIQQGPEISGAISWDDISREW